MAHTTHVNDTDVRYLAELAHRCRLWSDDDMSTCGGAPQFLADIADDIDETAAKLVHALGRYDGPRETDLRI
jgi:hypothetical protein